MKWTLQRVGIGNLALSCWDVLAVLAVGRTCVFLNWSNAFASLSTRKAQELSATHCFGGHGGGK